MFSEWTVTLLKKSVAVINVVVSNNWGRRNDHTISDNLIHINNPL